MVEREKMLANLAKARAAKAARRQQKLKSKLLDEEHKSKAQESCYSQETITSSEAPKSKVKVPTRITSRSQKVPPCM